MTIRLCCILYTAFCAAQVNLESAAREIAENETAFSKMSVQQGINAAFLEYLADDCVMFNPLPVNGKELYRKGTERRSLLSWKPTRVEIAASGDYGFSTGPWEIRTAKNDTPAAYGHFFSIWKKQRNGDWRVALDLGIRYPEGKKEREALQISVSQNAKTDIHGHATAGVLAAEKSFARAAAVRSLSDAYDLHASETIRVYRDGHFPAEGKSRGKKLATADAPGYSFNLLDTDLAPSGDLGYTYGVAVTPEKDSSLFVRVWRLEREWKLAIDILKSFK